MKISFKTYTFLKITIWLLFSIYLLFGLLALQNNYLIYTLIICIPIIRLTIIEFINKWYTLGHPKLLDWFRLATFLSLVLPFLSMIYKLDTTQTTLVFQSILIDNQYALDCVFVILIGLIALSLAELLIRLAPINFKWKTEKRAIYKLKKYYLFAVSAVLVMFANLFLVIGDVIGFGSAGVNLNASFLVQILNILSSIFLVSIAYFKFFNFYPKKNISLLLYVCLSLSLIDGFLSGMKENVIVPLILVLVPYFLAGNKPKLKQILIPVFILLFLYPLNNNYRSALNLYNSKPVAFYQALDKTFSSEIFQEKEKEYSITSRFQGFLPFLYGVSIEDEWQSFKYLNRYIYLPVAWFAPRFLLPNKPTADTGNELYQLMRNSKSTTVSITPTTYGWSYLEGGYIPMFITFLIYAFVTCLLERNLHLNNLEAIIIYTVLLTAMIKIESDIYFRINSVFQLLFIVFIFKKVFLKKLKITKYAS